MIYAISIRKAKIKYSLIIQFTYIFFVHHILSFVPDNWAFLYAQRLALKMEVPLHVCFCLVPKFLEATIRHYGFMMKGLKEVEQVSYRNQIF